MIAGRSDITPTPFTPKCGTYRAGRISSIILNQRGGGTTQEEVIGMG
jgi:hypothetical protein